MYVCACARVSFQVKSCKTVFTISHCLCSVLGKWFIMKKWGKQIRQNLMYLRDKNILIIGTHWNYILVGDEEYLQPHFYNDFLRFHYSHLCVRIVRRIRRFSCWRHLLITYNQRLRSFLRHLSTTRNFVHHQRDYIRICL